jgi:hypothetical protein
MEREERSTLYSSVRRRFGAACGLSVECCCGRCNLFGCLVSEAVEAEAPHNRLESSKVQERQKRYPFKCRKGRMQGSCKTSHPRRRNALNKMSLVS